MYMRILFVVMVACLPLLRAQSPVNVIFLEPVDRVDTANAEIAAVNPLFRKAADPQRYAGWLSNESAARALRLYREACDIVTPAGGTPDYFVALVPGGNHAAVGFRLQNGDAVEEHPKQPYILLDAAPGRFETTLLHETAHMAMALMAGGRLLEGNSMASVPHTTAALSDRTTAFAEGYAIHLETLAAHLNRDLNSRRRFHREFVLFGAGEWQAEEYFHHSVDLTSYSQNLARYADVRENNFAFESAFQGPDYLRVQLEKARDFATLRDANQLLQSEGFYASFFFLYVMRGSLPDEVVVTARERQLLSAMQAMFAAGGEDASSPWLVRFVLAYMEKFPGEKAVVVDALNDLSHGVFVDPGAATLWREHYLAALRLDLRNLNGQAIGDKRKQWREAVLADPKLLLSRLGPEVACTVPGVKVKLVALGAERPLRFDINTAPAAILRLIPGITQNEVAGWTGARHERAFAGAADLRARGGLTAQTLALLAF